MYDFNGQVIVVTGAAGYLGKVVARSFLDHKAIVCCIDQRKGRMDDLKSISQKSGKFYGFEEFDVTDKEKMFTLAEIIHNRIGSVNILVNTVGGFSSGEFVHELSIQTWQRMMDLNVYSFLSTTAAFVPDMIENKMGKVISIGSKSALQGGAGSGAYGAAKGALLRLTESMSEELKNQNIQVNCVIPGVIDTPENREAMPNVDFSKWVTPAQVADVILFLASSESGGVTGASIPVFGR